MGLCQRLALIGHILSSGRSEADADYDRSWAGADIACGRVRCTGISEGDIRQAGMPAAGERRPSVSFSR